MLNDFHAECSFVSLIGGSTREYNMLDLLLSTDTASINNPRLFPDFRTSDHCGVGFEIVGCSRRVVATRCRDCGHRNYAQINDCLLEYDWDFEFGSFHSLDDMHAVFLDLFNRIIVKAVPLWRNKAFSPQMPSSL